MPSRSVPCRPALVAILGGAILFSIPSARGQSPNPPKAEENSSAQKPNSSLLDIPFDIRTLDALSVLRGRTAALSAEGARTVAQRTAAVEAYRREAEAAGSPLRVSIGRFGVPKNLARHSGALSEPFAGAPEEAARNFLRGQRAIFPFSNDEIDSLRVTGREQIGRHTALRFQQTVGGVSVFGGHVRITVSESGEIVSAGVDSASPSLRLSNSPNLNVAGAVEAAVKHLGIELPTRLGPPLGTSGGWISYANPFGAAFIPVNSELTVFPMTATSARLAHRLILETARDRRYEILVDAEDGRVLLRHSLVRRHGSARVFTQHPAAGPRQVVQFPEGWIADTATTTRGNNVDAFLDSDGDDIPDPGPFPNMQNGRAFSPSASFDFPAGEGLSGQDPRGFPAAAVTNLFYFVNLAHNTFQALGFNEAAGNFQTNNFGMGGQANDAIIAEAQDDALTNNANFVLAPDGIPGRLQIGIFTGAQANSNDDDRDGAYDGDVIIHEYAHGVSSRLVGGPMDVSCLGGAQSNALGEGWSDYFSLSVFNNPVAGEYASGNATRGIRRSSYQNYPLTYADLGNVAFEEHLDGELWAAALWDLRQTIGRPAADRLIVDGMKLTPCDPSMIDARDGILMAELAQGNTRRRQLWEVFARHGMGFSARGVDGNIVEPTIFNEARDLHQDLLTQGANRNPKIESDPPAGAVAGFFLVGDNFSYLPQAMDPDGDTLTFALVSGPQGMAINAQNGTLGWTVAGFTAPRVVIAATDGKGGRVTHGFVIPILTLLNADQAITVNAPNGSLGFAAFLTNAGTKVAQLTTRGGTGDVDMLLLSSAGIFSSGRPGNDETLSVPAPGQGALLALLQPAPSYGNVALTARLPTPAAVAANGTRSNLSRVTSDESFFEVVVPAATPRVTISTTGPANGDVDLFVMKDEVPVCQRSVFVDAECRFDESSERAGNDEVIELVSPEAGSYFIDLSAFRAYSGVTLRASFANPAAVSAVSGDGQSGPVLTVLGAPLVVEATASGGPAVGVAVNFAVASGTALLRTRLAATGTNGRAQTEVLLGPTPGPIMISATVTGLPPVMFTVNATSTSTVNISPGGVVLATQTPVVSNIAASSIFSVYGSGFAAPDTFVGNPVLDAQNRVSTNLANTCLEINGARSPMFFVSEFLINAQASHTLTAGNASAVVIKNCGLPSEERSDPASATVANIAPAFFNFINNANGVNPIAALHADPGDLRVGQVGLVPGVSFAPAKPGEFISLFATGLGPTAPPVVAGGIPQLELPDVFGQSRVTGQVMVTIGGIMVPPEDIFYVGLAPCCAGLYQIVVRVPANAPAGNLPVEVKVNGVTSLAGPYITVQP